MARPVRASKCTLMAKNGAHAVALFFYRLGYGKYRFTSQCSPHGGKTKWRLLHVKIYILGEIFGPDSSLYFYMVRMDILSNV